MFDFNVFSTVEDRRDNYMYIFGNYEEISMPEYGIKESIKSGC